MSDKCDSCGRLNHEGLTKSAERYRQNPIFGTNLERPMSEIVNEIRNRLVAARGSIADFQFGYPAWKERTQHVEGLLTCGIVALYSAMEDIQKFEREHSPKTPHSGTPGAPHE